MTFCNCTKPTPYIKIEYQDISLKEGWCSICFNPIDRQKLINKCEFGCQPKLSWGNRIKQKEEEWRNCKIECSYKACKTSVRVMINTTDQQPSENISQELIVISLWNTQIEENQQNPYNILETLEF